MKKKWLAVLLCTCLAFAGCGSSGEEEGEEVSKNDGKGQSGSLLAGNKTPISTPVPADSGNGSEGDTGLGDITVPDVNNPAEDTGAYWRPQGSVVLGQYIGVSVSEEKAEVSDESVQSEIEYLLEQNVEPRAIEGRNIVEKGDYVCVDYTLWVDGEQVDSIDLVASQEVARLSVGGIFKRMLNSLFLQGG